MEPLLTVSMLILALIGIVLSVILVTVAIGELDR